MENGRKKAVKEGRLTFYVQCVQKNTDYVAGVESAKGGDRMKEYILKETASKFIRVRCPKCKNEQVMFGKAATNVLCLVCGRELAAPLAGKSKVKAKVVELLE